MTLFRSLSARASAKFSEMNFTYLEAEINVSYETKHGFWLCETEISPFRQLSRGEGGERVYCRNLLGGIDVGGPFTDAILRNAATIRPLPSNTIPPPPKKQYLLLDDDALTVHPDRKRVIGELVQEHPACGGGTTHKKCRSQQREYIRAAFIGTESLTGNSDNSPPDTPLARKLPTNFSCLDGDAQPHGKHPDTNL
ncbi:hypothetical protein GEV33_007889 [Tenebrio molitor]|uniref:Uncharacterized protein n=1 Tax=Tenebrio molitor TaxID=7067 RepID=A0A8J6HIC9_TENMO|nr:hypothetical protein GEV33_007889 [Tenebrio molitor]